MNKEAPLIDVTNLPSMPERKIIHLDMDCFFAAIEMLERPDLKTRPMAVGGRPENRGVISTCNYPARKFGIHSAMSSAQAFKRCPNLVLLSGRHELYKEYSQKIFDHVREYSEIIEPLSIDEAFIDVTDSTHCRGSATFIAQRIRKEIYELTGLTASAGISFNKFLAKVASDWRKPNGQFTVAPEHMDEFLQDLPLNKLPGVGQVTWQKLQTLNLKTCGELKQLTLPQLTEVFGKFGKTLYMYSRGLDFRPVSAERDRKSLSCEHTFSYDLESWGHLTEHITPLANELAERLQRFHNKPEAKEKILKSLVVKVKFHDFQTLTREKQLGPQELSPLWKEGVWSDQLKAHLNDLFHRAFHTREKPVRLLGLGVKMDRLDKEQVLDGGFQQLSFF